MKRTHPVSRGCYESKSCGDNLIGYEYPTQPVPERRFRRRVGVRRPVPGPDLRGRAPAPPRPAARVQRAPVGRQDRGPLAVPPPRLPAVARGLSAGPPVGGRGMLRGDGPRPPGNPPGRRRAERDPDRRSPRRADDPIHPRERRAGGGTTGTSGGTGPRSTSPWTRWAIYWPSGRHPPTLRSGPKSRPLAADVQATTGQTVTLAYVDQGYTGDQPAADAAAHGITLEVVKHTEAKKGFVLLPRRWVVERTFAWMARFRRLARDYERTAEALAGWHWLAFVTLMLQRLAAITGPGS